LPPRKLFYRLDLQTAERLEHSLQDDGIFVVCGAAKERERTGGPELGFTEVMIEEVTAYHGGMVPPSGRFRRDGYHYAELDVEYASHEDLPGTFIPGTFGGVSGGGLWRIEVGKAADGTYAVSEPLLAGVAFYQTPLVNQHRMIRCHAGDGVYVHTLQKLTEVSSRSLASKGHGSFPAMAGRSLSTNSLLSAEAPCLVAWASNIPERCVSSYEARCLTAGLIGLLLAGSRRL
jgi:hypothetical protein